MHDVCWLIGGLWLVLTGYLTFAAIGVKRDTRGHLGQSVALLLAIGVSFWLPHLSIFRFLSVTRVRPVASSVGVVLCLAGMVILVWARRCLGRNWSQTVSIKEEHELVTWGPYRVIRHPMYAGGLLACLGSAIACGGTWIVFLVVLGSLFSWRVAQEDRLMARQFPREYPAYMRGTKRLVPFVF